MKKNDTGKRLDRKDWKKIEALLKNKDKTIQQISDFYGISRTAIYSYAWRHHIFEKKKKSFWQKLWHSLPLVKLYYNEK